MISGRLRRAAAVVFVVVCAAAATSCGSTSSVARATSVKIKVVRPGVDEPIEMNPIRDKIAKYTINTEVKVAREGVDLSQNELAQARRRYEAGVATSIEVTDAQTRLERALDNQTTALYGYNVARIDLAQSMGRVRSTVQ